MAMERDISLSTAVVLHSLSCQRQALRAAPHFCKPAKRTTSETRTVVRMYPVTSHPVTGFFEILKMCSETFEGVSAAGRLSR